MSIPDLHPSIASPDPTVARARAMFHAVIPGWASDALTLRARGLDRPCHRDAFALGTRPNHSPTHTSKRWVAGSISPTWHCLDNPQTTDLRRAG